MFNNHRVPCRNAVFGQHNFSAPACKHRCACRNAEVYAVMNARRRFTVCVCEYPPFGKKRCAPRLLYRRGKGAAVVYGAVIGFFEDCVKPFNLCFARSACVGFYCGVPSVKRYRFTGEFFCLHRNRQCQLCLIFSRYAVR